MSRPGIFHIPYSLKPQPVERLLGEFRRQVKVQIYALGSQDAGHGNSFADISGKTRSLTTWSWILQISYFTTEYKSLRASANGHASQPECSRGTQSLERRTSAHFPPWTNAKAPRARSSHSGCAGGEMGPHLLSLGRDKPHTDNISYSCKPEAKSVAAISTNFFKIVSGSGGQPGIWAIMADLISSGYGKTA